jgi:hypothetical protein
MNKWVSGILVGVGMFAGLSATAQATTVYNVQSTSVVNCGSASHGLWTGQQNFSGGSCGNYYDNSGVYTVNDDDADTNNWTGTFNAFAINPQGTTANIALTFSDFAETAKYKTEGGVSYDENTDTPDIDFSRALPARLRSIALLTPLTDLPVDIPSSGARAATPRMPANLADLRGCF